ncbi:MAG: hypothetical protein AB8B63_19415 [Granulosicoccus sp.]
MHLIESAQWRLWANADNGAEWLAAQVNLHGSWQNVVPDCRRPQERSVDQQDAQSVETLAAASFHMIPYSNRIRDGNFNFQNQTYQLENSAGHAIHGALRNLPWVVIDATSSAFVCEIDSRNHAGVNWPWPIRARITHEINGASLSSTIELENLGNSAMPAGLGWHPYFVRQIGNSQPTLTLPVNSVFPDASGDCLPDGKAVALPGALDFRAPRQLDASQRIDCCFSGLSGSSIIHWREAGIRLAICASEECRFLVLFNPDKPYFAVEPVSNANDAFNLTSQGIDSGTRTVLPGQKVLSRLHIEASAGQ